MFFPRRSPWDPADPAPLGGYLDRLHWRISAAIVALVPVPVVAVAVVVLVAVAALVVLDTERGPAVLVRPPALVALVVLVAVAVLVLEAVAVVAVAPIQSEGRPSSWRDVRPS